jgi:hypothetical protein
MCFLKKLIEYIESENDEIYNIAWNLGKNEE